MKKLRKQEIAWFFYDFGNSAYALLVMTLFYPLYFSEYVFSGDNSEAMWGVTVAISILLVGILSPFLGAFSDEKSNRKSLFIFFSLITAIGTSLLALTGSISSSFGSLIFIAINFSFGISLFLYDSFLVVIPRKKEFSTTLSGIGWALGYIGGPLALFLVWIVLGGNLPTTKFDYNLTFAITGFFFFVVIIWPLVVLPSDKHQPDGIEGLGFIRTVIHTISSPWNNKKTILLFLFSMYFIMDGLTTIVYFTALFAKKELGFDIQQIVVLLLVVQLVAIPFTVIFCWLGEKYGEIKLLILNTLIWCCIVVLMYYNNDYKQYYLISALTGLVVGSTPALARGFLSKIIPEQKRAEIFGFNAFASRIATIIGPVLFGVVASKYGMRPALLTVLPFFLFGIVTLILTSNSINREKV